MAYFCCRSKHYSNGKVPTFIEEEIKNKIFSPEETNEACISEQQDGLKKVGIYQVSSELIFIDQLLYKNMHTNLKLLHC